VADHCSPDEPVAFYVNGDKYAGDPTAIELTFQKEIAVVIGSAPSEIPKTADFSQA
jgi:hypothetical protein